VPGDVSEAAFVLCCLAAVAGAVVQAVIGFGYALVLVPMLLLVGHELIPVAPLVVATPMVLWLAWADRHGLDLPGFGRLTAGRIPGTVVGVWLLGIVGATAISEVAGALLILAAAFSFVRGARQASPRLEVAAGFASGVAGTVSAVGGPYLGLAFADRPPAVLRATISLAFAVGLVISLLALMLAGRIERDPVVLGVALVPATAVGLWAGRAVAHRADPRWLRPAVLVFAAAAGTFAIVRGLTG
jgi:uncharacterized membrane protein YfcA